MKKLIVWLFLVTIAVAGCKGPDAGSVESFAADGYGNYIEAYADRYAVFSQTHKDMGGMDVLLAVNLGMDRSNYEDAVIWHDPAALTVLVSKHYGLPEGYRPENMVAVDRKYAQSGVLLREDCCRAFIAMARAMENEGLHAYIKSGYRVNTKRGGADSPWYAWPGYSEHQTGLAFDLRKRNVTYKTLSEYAFEKTREYAWLLENAYAYGFVLSYPKGKTKLTGYGYEPWHWRYVGLDAAADMRDKGFGTFQEYWATCLIRDVLR